MSDRELDLDTLLIAMTVLPHDETIRDELDKLIDAIHAASDQDTATWLLAGGKRIARITPVDEITGVAWPEDAGVSAAQFIRLPMDRRREILDQFYERLHGEPS